MLQSAGSKRVRSMYVLIQNIRQVNVKENQNEHNKTFLTSSLNQNLQKVDAFKSKLVESLQNYTAYRYVSIAPIQVEQPKRKRTDLSDSEFEDMLSSGNIQLFDVRDEKEIEKYGKIPTATNIPLPKLKCAFGLSEAEFEALHKIPKPKKEHTNIVYYGRTEVKSLAALEIVHKLGYIRAKHYPGGWDMYCRLNPDCVKS